MSVKPISAYNITATKRDLMPDAVMLAFNQLIAQNWDGYESSFKQKDIVQHIVFLYNQNNQCNPIDDNDVFSKGWLDIEDIYGKEGWKVDYDKPGYNESYDASFTFTKKKKQKKGKNGSDTTEK